MSGTQEAPAAAELPFTVGKDEKGNRTIRFAGSGNRYTLRRIGTGTMLRVLEAAGDQSGNQTYIQQATVIASVAEMNGEKMPFPTSKALLIAAGDKIPDAESFTLMMAYFMPEKLGMDASPDKADWAAAKN